MRYRPFKTFLVGLGNIGMGYDLNNPESQGRTHARALEKHPNFTCVGAHDISSQASQAFEKHYSVKSYPILSQGLSETQPEVVIISSPTHLHTEHIHKVLEISKPRVILCEKPLTLTSSEAIQVLGFAKKLDVKIFVNYFRNSNPTSIELRKWILEDQLKSPFVGIAHYNKGTLHTGSHFLNLLTFWFGEPLKVGIIKSEPNRFDTNDPNRLINLRFKGGEVSLVPVSDEKDLVFKMSIDFANGTLKYENEGNLVVWSPDEHSSGNGIVKVSNNFEMSSNFDKSQFDVLENIACFLNNSEYSLCEGSSALDYISLLTGTE
jgi:predicted dehydrogenase